MYTWTGKKLGIWKAYISSLKVILNYNWILFILNQEHLSIPFFHLQLHLSPRHHLLMLSSLPKSVSLLLLFPSVLAHFHKSYPKCHLHGKPSTLEPRSGIFGVKGAASNYLAIFMPKSSPAIWGFLHSLVPNHHTISLARLNPSNSFAKKWGSQFFGIPLIGQEFLVAFMAVSRLFQSQRTSGFRYSEHFMPENW